MSQCHPCQAEGITVAATRVRNGVYYCEPCFRGIGGDIPTVPAESQSKEEVKVPTSAQMQHAKTVDYTAMQNDRSDGMSVPDIRKKYGVSAFSVYNHTKKGEAVKAKGPGSGNYVRKKRRGLRAPIVSRRSDDAVAIKPNGSLGLDAVLNGLRMQRTAIDTRIAVVEGWMEEDNA